MMMDNRALRALRAHVSDNVATVLDEIQAEDTVAVSASREVSGGETIVAATAVPKYHKLALRPIAAGEAVVKYGETIGEATADIAAGAHVHIENIRSRRGRR
jgi:altronate dehydratase